MNKAYVLMTDCAIDISMNKLMSIPQQSGQGFGVVIKIESRTRSPLRVDTIMRLHMCND